jgi:hypothetical protein
MGQYLFFVSLDLSSYYAGNIREMLVAVVGILVHILPMGQYPVSLYSSAKWVSCVGGN